jgi:hypothetical protein
MKRCFIASVFLIILLPFTICYAEIKSYPLGHYPNQVVLSDVNNDHYVDILASNQLSNDISVLINDGSGYFANNHLPYQTGMLPAQLVTCDIDNDHDIDMLVSCYIAWEILIYHNNGDGTFADPDNLAIERYVDIAVDDLDNDNYPDLILVYTNGDKFEILMNNKDGTFKTPVSFTVGASPKIPLFADVTGDGFNDIIMSPNYGRGIWVSQNNGDGTFKRADQYYVVTEPSSYYNMCLTDFDGNGSLDLVVSYGGVNILLNQGDGTFLENHKYYDELRPTYITTGDLNNDGYPEVITAGGTEGWRIYVMNNSGNGTLTSFYEYVGGNSTMTPSIGDLDNDGFADIVVSNNADGDISILMNNGDGTFAPQLRLGKSKDPYTTILSDVNKDGYPDIIVCSKGLKPNYEGFVTAYINHGDGTFDIKENNVSMDLQYEPFGKVVFKSGDKVSIVLDLTTPSIPLMVDIYFVMIKPVGLNEVYSAMSWDTGVFPAATNLYLPNDYTLKDATLLEMKIPSDKPPVSNTGLYEFAIALFEHQTGRLVSNIPTTSFEVVE